MPFLMVHLKYLQNRISTKGRVGMGCVLDLVRVLARPVLKEEIWKSTGIPPRGKGGRGEVASNASLE